MIKPLIMQDARPSFLIKKLSKVNMSSILSGFGMESKVKEFVLEMEKYYDVQRPERDNKVSKAITFW